MKKQAVRPRFPARYRPARVNTCVLGCPAQPAFSFAFHTEDADPANGARAFAHQPGFNGGND
jgi:hypothetical protein